jgi:hypothetical protein
MIQNPAANIDHSMDLDDDKAGWEAEREAEFETSMVAGADI